MKRIRIIKLLAMVGLAAGISLVQAAPVRAHTAVKWCVKWRSQYVDAHWGEIVFPTDLPAYWAAMYTRYQIVRNDTGEVISTGYLDVEGCTGYLTAVSGKEYKVRMGTLVHRSGVGLIYVHPDNTLWGPSGGYIYYNSYINVGLLAANSHTTMPVEETALDAKTNAMPIVGKVFEQYDMLAYPLLTNTYIHTDCYEGRANGDCCGDSAVGMISGTTNLCLAGSYYNSTPVTGWKFIVGHEIGHIVSDVNGGPITDSTHGYNHENQTFDCSCSHVLTGGNAHCLQSAEPILAGETEGFAHFFSTALFNGRILNFGVFVYPKETIEWNGYNWVISAPETDWNAWQDDPVIPEDDPYDQWLERKCNYITDKGVELDWLRFFYEIWTYNDMDKFSIAQILDVWEKTSDEYKKWDSLVAEVNEHYHDKLWLFNQIGAQAGVDN